MGLLQEYLKQLREIIFRPKEFFKNMPNTGGYGKPFKFAIISAFIGALLSICYKTIIHDDTILQAIQMAGSFPIYLFFTLPVGLVILMIYESIILFAGAGINHLFFLVLGTKKSYETTFKIMAYLNAFAVLTWIPTIGYIVLIYAIYPLYLAGKYVHEIPKKRLIIACVLLLIIVLAGISMIFLTAWIASFTEEQRDNSEVFEKKIICAYSNIEIDDEYVKFDPANKIFYAFITNTGADPITLTKVEPWIDGKKQLPIMLNSNNLALTAIEKNKYLQIYVNVSSGFLAGGSTLTKIEFGTECESVFASTTMPQGDWNGFTWNGEQLANK